MKTMTMILAALLTLHMNILMAGNDIAGSSSSSATPAVDLSALIPATPAEATFEEMVPAVPGPDALAPATPAEAEFEEVSPMIDLMGLAPVSPSEADFTDSIDPLPGMWSLTPNTPMEADFE